MLPPAGHVHANSAASQSHTTVPSVLRPEQLNQPYREDSDDEGGYILGAWHYDDDPSLDVDAGEAGPGTSIGSTVGAAAADADGRTASPAKPTPTVTSSGFSRVAGGRSNLDSPFTMAAGTSTASQSGSDNRMSGGGGAMQQLAPGSSFPHARGQSHSAIMDAVPPSASVYSDPTPNGGARRAVAGSGGKGRVPEHLHAGDVANTGGPSVITTGDEFPRAGGPSAARRRRWWPGFGLFPSTAASTSLSLAEEEQTRTWGGRGGEAATPMLRPHSDEAVSAAASPGDAASASSSANGPPGSRTFVVIRDRRTNPRPSPLSQTHTQGSDMGLDEDPGAEERSFTVVRPNRTARSSLSLLAGPSSPSSFTSQQASHPDIPLRSTLRNRETTP